MDPRQGETLPVGPQVLQVLHKVLQEAGLSGDQEVKENAVVEGYPHKEKQEDAVRVAAAGTGPLQNQITI